MKFNKSAKTGKVEIDGLCAFLSRWVDTSDEANHIEQIYSKHLNRVFKTINNKREAAILAIKSFLFRHSVPVLDVVYSEDLVELTEARRMGSPVLDLTTGRVDAESGIIVRLPRL
jgi:hypothetical protein